ncbi:MAG: hypothetical protein O2960_27385 [Verrucomicrobia bacterium]|nr:hypothetical protein [Verrucomicrobiota bacterium]
MKYLFRKLVYVPLATLIIAVGTTALHAGFGICLLKLKRFDKSERIPIADGLPLQSTVDRALSGEIVLGSSIVGAFERLCSNCHLIASFRRT